MPPDDPSGARPAPVVLRIKLRYDDVETLAARFAPNVGKSGLFLPTKSMQAVGAEVKFELRLADDKVVITGLGKVRAAKAPDPEQPRAAFGMAIELTRVTRESRDVILKILAKRKELGLPEVAIPMPDDIDAARAVDTGVREAAASAIPAGIPTTIDSSPILGSGPITKSSPIPIPSAPPTIDSAQATRDSGPIRDSSPILDSGPIPAESSPVVLTAPRRSGPIAIAKVHTITALGPEPTRKKRPALTEVIERASGPVAAVTVNLPGLDDDVDVAAVMAMARSLAGSMDMDAELEALRDSISAPIEISIEAASAELARQLGGAAVRRGWAVPPPVEEAKPVVVEPLVEAKPEEPAAPVIEEPTPVEEPPTEEPKFVASSTEVEPAVPIERALSPVDLDTPVTPQFALTDEDAGEEENEVEPAQIADEIHQLGETDFEEVEHTVIGGEPEPESEPTPVFTEPAVAAAIEASLDQQLADADSEPDDLGFAQHGEPVASAEPVEEGEEELEEIEDFEILAEADEEDADLLSAHGEQEASGTGHAYAEPQYEQAPRYAEQPEAYTDPEQLPVQRPSYDYSRHSDPDFHARLELSDEHPRAPAYEEDDEPPVHLDPRELSAGQALAAFEEPSANYPPVRNEFEEDFDSQHADFHKPSAYARAAPVASPGFPPLSKFDESDVHQLPEPRFLRQEQHHDLETALEALDVDLDDLSIPHAKTERGPTIPPPTQTRSRAPSQRLPVQRAPTSGRVQTRVPKRPTTDDGVLIDFDDDDE